MKAQQTLEEILQGFAIDTIGQAFFRSLSEYLSQALRVDYVFIGELASEDQTVCSLVFLAHGKEVKNVSYPLVGSLCEKVVAAKSLCAFPRDVQQQFPHNQALKRFNVDSYIGMPLQAADGRVIGILYVMSQGPIQDLEHVQLVLGIMVKRASLELERFQQERALEANNQALLLVNDQLRHTQQALEASNQELEAKVERRTAELRVREAEMRTSLQQVTELNQTLRRLNERLQEREAFLSNIVSQTSVGIAQTDLSGRFTYANEGYQRLVGRSLAELQQMTLMEITHPEDLSQNLHLLTRLTQTGHWFELEKRYQRPDGTLVWVLNNVSLVEQGQAKPPHIMAVCQDITQKKQAEHSLEQAVEELAQANQLLSQINADLDSFVYSASHDLRSPIATMQGLFDLLGRRLGDKLELNDQVLLGHLSASMQKLNRTIGDLTQIVQASKDTEQPAEAILLEDLLTEVKEDIAPLLLSTQAEVYTEWQVTSIRFPRKVLRSVLYNLLSNAVKYRHPDRPAQVTLKTEKVELGVRLSVEDNGLGLTQAQTGKLFKMFSRLHTHVEGTGIGLYTTKRMVENYGGSIWVESTPGKGTTFKVVLPNS
jgi:PAS domain S-box-containing protein